MNRSTYLDCPDVPRFRCMVCQARDRRVGARSRLVEREYHKNPRTWSCTSLYDAHKRYCWDSKDFGQTSEILDRFRGELRDTTAAGKDEFADAPGERG